MGRSRDYFIIDKGHKVEENKENITQRNECYFSGDKELRE
jgi:hypothetical protein